MKTEVVNLIGFIFFCMCFFEEEIQTEGNKMLRVYFYDVSSLTWKIGEIWGENFAIEIF
jgi:hypothetical protein